MQISTKTASDLLHLAKSKLHTGFKALTIAALGGALLAVPGISQAATLTNLGTLDDGTYASTAWAVSSDGSTVVGKSEGEAFLWTASSGMTGLGTLSGSTSCAYAVSGDGTTVAGFSKNSDNKNEAFIWTASSGMTSLGTLGGNKSYAKDVSDDGTIVTGSSKDSDGNTQAYIWTAETGMTSIGSLTGENDSNYSYSAANAISGDGTTVVGRSKQEDENTTEAFIWTEENGMQGLGALNEENFYSNAQDVSNDGSVVVGYSKNSDSKTEAFIWTEEDGMTGLGILDGTTMSQAWAVSGDGSTVVGQYCQDTYEDYIDAYEAFIWTEETGMVSLWDLLTEEGVDLDGWASLYQANDVSDDGSVIVGYGYDDENIKSAFIIDLNASTINPAVPVPGAVWLLGSGLVGLVGLRRRNGQK